MLDSGFGAVLGFGFANGAVLVIEISVLPWVFNRFEALSYSVLGLEGKI